MISLSVPEIPKDQKFLNRTLKTLLNNFKLTSGKQLNNAVLFSVYLIAIGRIQSAIEFLESFVNNLEPVEGDTNIWGAVGRGVILLAYIYNKKGNLERESELLKRVIDEDIMSDRCSRAIYLSEDLAEYKNIMEHAKNESQKYNCEIVADQILNFIYYYEMWPQFGNDVHGSEKGVIEKIINDSYIALLDAINQ